MNFRSMPTTKFLTLDNPCECHMATHTDPTPGSVRFLQCFLRTWYLIFHKTWEQCIRVNKKHTPIYPKYVTNAIEEVLITNIQRCPKNPDAGKPDLKVEKDFLRFVLFCKPKDVKTKAISKTSAAVMFWMLQHITDCIESDVCRLGCLHLRRRNPKGRKHGYIYTENNVDDVFRTMVQKKYRKLILKE